LKVLKETISLNIIKCKNMIDKIKIIDLSKAQQLEIKLQGLIENYNNEEEQTNQVLTLKTKNTVGIDLLLQLEELLSEISYMYDLYEIEIYFNDVNNLSSDYEDVVLKYDMIVKKIGNVSNKLELDKLTFLLQKKYEFLYKIMCRAVLEKEEFPTLSKTDLEYISDIIEKELSQVNSNVSLEINVEDIREYIKYLNEIKKNSSKKSFFDNLKDKISSNMVLVERLIQIPNEIVRGNILEDESLAQKKKISTQEFKKLDLEDRNMGIDLTSYNLSEVNFDDLDVMFLNLEGTGARINPQKVKSKSLYKTNLRGLNLSSANFYTVYIERANLEGTGAKIDPQTVSNKKLCYANLKGLDLSNADFTGVDIEGANLEETQAKIDPQYVKYGNLRNANLRGLDLSEADFECIIIEGANLEETQAKINPQTVVRKNLFGTNLKGLDLSGANFTDVDIRGANLEGTNAKINPQKVKYKSLENTNLKGLDLSQVDFTGVDITGANLEGTGARVIIDGKEVVFERENVEEITEVKKR